MHKEDEERRETEEKYERYRDTKKDIERGRDRDREKEDMKEIEKRSGGSHIGRKRNVDGQTERY